MVSISDTTPARVAGIRCGRCGTAAERSDEPGPCGSRFWDCQECQARFAVLVWGGWVLLAFQAEAPCSVTEV